MSHSHDDDDLSDAAIESLLNRAEVQLASNRSSALTKKQNNALTRREESRFPAAPVQSTNSIARVDAAALVEDDGQGRSTGSGVKKVEDPIKTARAKKEAKKATAGADWFHLPRTHLTPQLKRDLQVLRMRNVLDPKRHYKKDNSAPAIPEFSQTGTIIEGPTDFYSGRLSRKERKATLLESVLEGERNDGRFKAKYDELNKRKRSGRKGEFKERMRKRYAGKTLKR